MEVGCGSSDLAVKAHPCRLQSPASTAAALPSSQFYRMRNQFLVRHQTVINTNAKVTTTSPTSPTADAATPPATPI